MLQVSCLQQVLTKIVSANNEGRRGRRSHGFQIRRPLGSRQNNLASLGLLHLKLGLAKCPMWREDHVGCCGRGRQGRGRGPPRQAVSGMLAILKDMLAFEERPLAAAWRRAGQLADS